MAYSVCHAPLELLVKCHLKFIQSKSVIFSNNIILCYIWLWIIVTDQTLMRNEIMQYDTVDNILCNDQI